MLAKMVVQFPRLLPLRVRILTSAEDKEIKWRNERREEKRRGRGLYVYAIGVMCMCMCMLFPVNRDPTSQGIAYIISYKVT